MDWLVYRPGRHVVTAAVEIARRLGMNVPEERVPDLQRVSEAEDGEAHAGPLRAWAHTEVRMNRDGDDIPYTTQNVELAVAGGVLVFDSLRATGRGAVSTEVMDEVRAWDVEQVVPRVEWATHPTLPDAWRSAIRTEDLLARGVRWRSSVTTVAHALVERDDSVMLVGVTTRDRARPLASVLGAWSRRAGPPPAVGQRLEPRGRVAPAELAARVGVTPVLEWESREAPPAALWHLHLRPTAVVHCQRWRAGNHVVRGTVRADGGGMEWLIQPREGDDWCAHVEGVHVEERWHWDGFTTHVDGTAHLERLLASSTPAHGGPA